MKKIEVGDPVRLIGIPDWLVHDLPEDEQREIHNFVGKTARVTKIDDSGNYWIGFGTTMKDEENSVYSGHSLGVPKEYIELVVLTQT